MNKNQKLVQQQFINNEEAVIKRLKSVYKQSLSDIEGKAKALQKDIEELDKLAKLPISDEEKEIILSKKRSKVYQKQYQESLKKQVSGIYDSMLKEEYKTVSDYLNQCYEDGFVGTMFDLQGQGIPLSFPLDQEAMVRAVQLDSKISQGLYSRLGEDITTLKKKITAQVSRGISTGMSFEQVAKQLAGYTNIGYNNAIRIARTEGHRIQVQAGMDACYKAKNMGADVVKQWDSTLDGATRESHAKVDGEIRELDKEFSNGLMFPGDPSGGAAEVVNCRCALLQRARWALDEDELKTLQERAEFFGLDKTDSFEEYKKSYLKATEPQKKEYLTKKKLEQKIADGQKQLADLNDEFFNTSGHILYEDIISDFGSLEDFAKGEQLAKLKSIKSQIDSLQPQVEQWEDLLDKKLVKAEMKKLKKEQILLQDQLDGFDIKTYSNIWKDDVTTLDYASKQGSIQAKKSYFEQKLKYATDPDDIKKWQGLLDDLDDFEKSGAEYLKIKSQFDKTSKDLTNLQKSGTMKKNTVDDVFSQDRKDAAYWFTDQNGGVKGADGVLRDKCGEVWRNAPEFEKDSIYEYTRSYSKFNEPLRGIEYGTNKYLGVGNVDLDTIGINYGGYKRGEVKKQIDAMTSIIEKSTYDSDIWVQRGCGYGGMDKFFGINSSDFYLSESELAAKLLGTTPTEYGFFSTGVSKGKGFSHQPIIMNVYAPSGTKMMYVEPFSAFGNGSGRSWDGISSQRSFGSEAEMIFQRDTTFRVTKVEKTNGKIYIDMEVIDQGVH